MAEEALVKALAEIDDLTKLLSSSKAEVVGDANAVGTRVNDLIGCLQMVFDAGSGTDELSLGQLPTEVLAFLDIEKTKPDQYQDMKNDKIEEHRKLVNERVAYLQRISALVEFESGKQGTATHQSETGKKRRR